METRIRGKVGEGIARVYLEDRGFKILSTNFHCHHGELDIVARNAESLVFVEVKCRRNPEAMEQAVGPKKVRSLLYAARAFMHQAGLNEDFRFMVLYVILPKNDVRDASVHCLEDPF
ncbi:MAG: YraN family protein [Planctomycetota bacterium]|jgi:putative endonuclease